MERFRNRSGIRGESSGRGTGNETLLYGRELVAIYSSAHDWAAHIDSREVASGKCFAITISPSLRTTSIVFGSPVMCRVT